MPRALLALALSAFAIGTTEFVIMGLLPEVAADLAVDLPSAGLLISGYALGVAVGAPILALLTARLPRRQALLGLMGLFILGNALAALAGDYAMLMLARVVAAFCHGAFFGIGAVVAADLAAPQARARAIALMFTGLTLANVLGVPGGTLLGHGLGWRATFWAVTGLGGLAVIALLRWVPSHLPQAQADFRSELRHLNQVQVWLALGMTILGFGGVFVLFTYIAPLLRDVSGFSPLAVSWALLLIGLGLTLGNYLGGRLADWRLLPALMVTLAALALSMLLFAWASPYPLLALLALFVWSALSFATVPMLQLRVVQQAAGAPNLASTLNIGAFNLGNALGAWLGGWVIGQGLPLAQVPIAGAGVALSGLLLTAFSAWLERRTTLAAPNGLPCVQL
ncbi:MAG: MFS transporter [Pseudomonas sp.]